MPGRTAYDADVQPMPGPIAASHPDVAALETRYAAYVMAWGAWMTGHHAGLDPAREGALAADLVAARTSVAEALSAVEQASAPIDDPLDASAVATMRAALPDLDAWAAPLDGVALASPADLDQEAGETTTIAALRRRTFDAWGAAMASIADRDRRIDRLTALARLAGESDRAARRALFLAMEPAWRAVNADDGADSPYRRLLASSAAAWARHGSPIDANAAALGLEPAAVEATMRAMLRAYRARAIGPGRIEPWDYHYRTGAVARRLDPLVTLDRLRPINDAHLRAIGADPEVLGIRYDIEPRAGRPVIPTAFTVARDLPRFEDGAWRAATPWVFATYAEGGLGNLEELVHESGHALHYAAVRTRPAHVVWPPDQTAFVEAIADVVSWSVHEPAFLAEHLGADVSVTDSVVARYGSVMLDAAWTLFELEVHRHPDRSPNEAWAEIVEDELGIHGHPEWSWWALRGQLIDGPGYLANYALGAIMVAAVRAAIADRIGPWAVGNPRWYGWVSERLLVHGGAVPPRRLLGDLLDGPLTVAPLLADLERTG